MDAENGQKIKVLKKLRTRPSFKDQSADENIQQSGRKTQNRKYGWLLSLKDEISRTMTY